MKLNEKIIELLTELSAVETTFNKSLFNKLLFEGDGLFLRKNLLCLYHRTNNTQSHKLIIRIMAEGGYPWFAKLAKDASESVPLEAASQVSAMELTNMELGNSLDNVMSDDEFLELLPANGHFH